MVRFVCVACAGFADVPSGEHNCPAVGHVHAAAVARSSVANNGRIVVGYVQRTRHVHAAAGFGFTIFDRAAGHGHRAAVHIDAAAVGGIGGS